MYNINTKEYWDSRFNSGDWEQKKGRLQTRLYAKNNLRFIKLDKSFTGTILDFGCGLGDSIPLYKEQYPNAKFIGIDISYKAAEKAKQAYGNYADFYQGDFQAVPVVDVIIASHVFEHLTNDKDIAGELLKKCNKLFISVPYKEKLLFNEHVNSYDVNYYNEFPVVKYNVFTFKYSLCLYEVRRWYNINFKNIFKKLLNKKIREATPQIIFCLQGQKK